MALNKICPVFEKEKEISKIMCKDNCTHKKGLLTYLHKLKRQEKISHENYIVNPHDMLSNDTENNNGRMSYMNVCYKTDCTWGDGM